jgi:hypothetical protein
VRRRAFLLLLFISGVAYLLWDKLAKNNKSPSKFWSVISVVQNIILPYNPPHPSSNEIGATKYLVSAYLHKTFPKNDLTLLYDGVKNLLEFESNFLFLNPKEQEDTVSKFHENNNVWLDLLTYYTIEALLCDDIYSGNNIGYKWLGHKAGVPKPTKQYGGINV